MEVTLKCMPVKKQNETNKQKQTNKTNQNQIKAIPLVQNYNC